MIVRQLGRSASWSGARDGRRQTDQSEAQPFFHDQGDDISCRSTERESDSEFVRALGHSVGDYAVNTHAGKQ